MINYYPNLVYFQNLEKERVPRKDITTMSEDIDLDNSSQDTENPEDLEDAYDTEDYSDQEGWEN